MKYVLLLCLAFLLLGASVEDAQKANKAYENGNYEEAISLYQQAIDANPDNAKLYFNLASAQAKAGNSEEAIRTFEQYKTMTDKPEEEGKADYNIGKILTDLEQWDEAVKYYRQSLRYMSSDPDAKHNFELAQRKKQEQEDQQDQQQQNQDQDQQQDQNQDQNEQQQNQQQNEQQDQQQQQQNQDQQNQEQQKQQQKLSQAEAEKILKALEQKEKELLQQFKKKETESSKSKNEKDW